MQSPIIKPLGQVIAKIEIVMDIHGTVNMNCSQGLHPLKVAEILSGMANQTLVALISQMNKPQVGVVDDGKENNPPDNGDRTN